MKGGGEDIKEGQKQKDIHMCHTCMHHPLRAEETCAVNLLPVLQGQNPDTRETQDTWECSGMAEGAWLLPVTGEVMR